MGNNLSDQESVHRRSVSNLITHELGTIVEAADSDLIISKCKAVNTLLPCAVFLGGGCQQGVVDAILHATRVSDSRFNLESRGILVAPCCAMSPSYSKSGVLLP